MEEKISLDVEKREENQVLFAVIAMLGVLLPCQYALKIKGVSITIADLAIIPLAFVIFLNVLKQKSFLKCVPFLLLLLFPLAQIPGAFSTLKGSAKELIQSVLYFGVYGFVFRYFFRKSTNNNQSKIFHFLILGAFIVIIWGWVDYLSGGIAWFHIDGGSTNVRIFNVILAIISPFIFAVYAEDKESRLWIPMCFIVGALPLMFTFIPFVSLIGGFLYLVWQMKDKKTMAVLLCSLGLGIIGWFIMPRNAPHHTLASVLPFRVDEKFEPRENTPKQEIAEFQAAVNMWREKPLFGVGVGNYQKNIQPFFGILPNPSFNDTEKVGHYNQYLLILAEGGLVSLLVFVFILFVSGVKILARINDKNTFESQAAFVALMIIAFCAVDSEVLVRGVLPLMILVFSFCLNEYSESDQKNL